MLAILISLFALTSSIITSINLMAFIISMLFYTFYMQVLYTLLDTMSFEPRKQMSLGVDSFMPLSTVPSCSRASIKIHGVVSTQEHIYKLIVANSLALKTKDSMILPLLFKSVWNFFIQIKPNSFECNSALLRKLLQNHE